MEILERFEEIVRNLKHCPVIFEIGINNGYHTNLMNNIIKKYHQEYKYFAFEPDKRLRGAIDGIVGVHPRIAFSDCAVGQVEGELTFHLSGGEEKRPGVYKQAFTGSSSIRKPKNALKYWPDMTFEKTTCRCTTIDKVVKDNKLEYIDFIWMDTQGAESDVFKGAVNSLPKIQFIFTEIGGENDQYEGQVGLDGIKKLLSGFEIVEDYKGDVFFKRIGV